ncbi:AMP-binding protein [Mycolicibacterium thermoresistibile]
MVLIDELISRAAETTPDRPAVVTPGATPVTFAEFDRRVHAVASWLTDRTRRGDRVAVVADNSADYAVLYYAVPRSGRVLTPINQRLHADEQAAQLHQTQAVVLFGDSNHLAALDSAVPPGNRPAHVVAFGSPSWQLILAADPAPLESPADDDPAWLLFTSGSTGAPKPVVHTHRSVLAGVRGTVTGRSVRPGVYLLPFPMCHIAGYNMLVQHAVGATVVLVDRFRPETFAQAVNDLGVTSCSLAPTMVHSLLTYLTETDIRLPTLSAIAYGSAAMPAGLIRRAIDLLDVDFHQGYGMTETAGNITFLGPDEHRSGDPAILASAGRPHDGVQLRIVDPHGVPVAAGQTGEIQVRGAQVSAPGWLATGDIGRIDADGRLTVVDRAKDIIITGGENVSSREVEDVLSGHPDVDMCAVVAAPDEHWGEAVCAVVVPRRSPAPDAEDLVSHVRSRLAAFKRPRYVLFVDALPLTPNGKVAKDAVRRYVRDRIPTPSN